MTGLNNKAAAINWDEFRASIHKNTPVDQSESAEEKRARITRLEANPQAWKEYYFKKFFAYESPDFHKNATDRLIKNFKKKKHWYEVRQWVRGLSKTTTAMMDILYLVLTGEIKNVIYTSSTYDAACRFLTKWQCQLDSNQRIINDYGKQELEGFWKEGFFKARNGAQFLAAGAGNQPRGNGNDEIRPDCLVMDDFDTDEECLNEDRINKKWRWFEQALFFTVDTAKPYLILWLGNVIAPDCCVVRAGLIADHCEQINIRDQYGKSTWPEKNSEEDIDYQISKVSYESSQQELFNNPMRQGQTFKAMHYGKCPPLRRLEFAVVYADPSPSNSDKPSLKSRAQNSCKSVVILGFYEGKYYLYKCWVDHTTNANFIDWLFLAKWYVGNACPLYMYIENNTLQNPIYEQVYKSLVYEREREYNETLPLSVDDEKKGDKWTRIEATLEPLVRLEQLICNEAEKESEHMKRMEKQFINASANSRHLDGPDAVQGGVKIIERKTVTRSSGQVTSIPRKRNPKRY